MKQENDSKVRLPPSMGEALHALILEAEGDPEMLAKLERGGRITRSAMLRECLSRGMASVRGALRARTPEPKPPTEPPAQPKPTAKPKKKPAKKRR